MRLDLGAAYLREADGRGGSYYLANGHWNGRGHAFAAARLVELLARTPGALP